MDPDLPRLPPMSREDSFALARRRRGRNIAMLVVLVAVAALFYAIAMVKLAKPGLGS
jgi:hypothetical protein